jgi:lambda family phage minor tail protein L
MTRDQAQLSLKNLYGEALSLTPSALVSLFEIDVSDIAFSKGLIDEIREDNENERIFRFHNNISLITSNLTWQGKVYTAAPISAEGFEMNARGTLPVPKLSMSVSPEAIPLLGLFKNKLKSLGDLAGAKVTRIRTLAKYLDAINFTNGINPDADPNSEFPRDVFYIDRKSLENKSMIEFELASILDVEGVKLPFRLVVANRCVFTYRGEGCLYESEDNRVINVHGYPENSRLPSFAPPVANEKDESITDLLPVDVALSARGKWRRGVNYVAGDWVFIEKDGVKYHFVAKSDVPPNHAPPNGTYWHADACSKLLRGCRLRWGVDGNGLAAPGRRNGDPFNGCLPFGGYPATNKVK